MTKGRKPLHEADPDIISRLVEALKAGNYVDDACAYAGIAESTYYLWMERGRRAAAALAAGETPKPADAPYVEIMESASRARSAAVVRNVNFINRAASEGTWQAAAWWLERTRPDKFGRRLATELSGPAGGPIEVEMVTAEELENRIAALLGEQREEE